MNISDNIINQLSAGKNNDNIINELSVVGKVNSIISLIAFGVVGTLFLIAGIILMFKKDNYKKVNAVVENQNCIYKNRVFTCNTTVSYFVNGIPLKGIILLDKGKKQGDIVNIYYDEDNINNITYTHDSVFMVGLIVTIFSIIFLGLTIVSYYSISKNKMYEARQGIQTIRNLF